MKRGRLIAVLGAGAFCLLALAPFAWLVITSFKTQLEVTAIPPHSLAQRFAGVLPLGPDPLRAHALRAQQPNRGRGAPPVCTLCLGVGAAYALARLRVPGRPWLMGALLLVSMFPQISLAGPIWRILQAVGWLGTYQGLIIPYVTLTLPLAVWILTSYFSELPHELEEAAMLDGCGRLGALVRVILPLAGPGGCSPQPSWFSSTPGTRFFFALPHHGPAGRCRPCPWASLCSRASSPCPGGEIAAASTVATAPLVLLVFIFQRRIVSGLSAGAIKG